MDTDPHAFTLAADRWIALADDLDGTAEDLIQGTQNLPWAWPSGDAAAAAQAKARDTRNEASNAAPPCHAIGRALHQHADTLRSLQGMVHNIMDEAAGRGYDVDLTAGTVTAGARTARDSAAGQAMYGEIQSYIAQLHGVLDQAASCDQRTAATIRANLPDPATGFGLLAAPAVTAAQV